jgi:GNAT superfamily N-acetyltransferase
MSIRYERVTDGAGAQAIVAVESAAVAVDHPGLLPDTVEDFVGVLDGTPSEHLEFELVYDGVEVVGWTFVMLPTKDNTHTANMSVTIAPSARGRGIGRAAAARTIERIRAEGRTVIVCFIGAPFGATAPGDGLASSFGAVSALESVRRALDLREVDDTTIDAALAQGVADHAAGYEVVQWLDRVPDELVDRAAAILPLVSSDSPRGELEFDDEVWDAQRFRDYEATIQRRGRRLIATGAVDRASGRLVAYTELSVPTTRHELAGQWGTIVEGEHRGHRLGLLVKAENLRMLRRHFPDTMTVTTWNAVSNRHMIAVNEALGFRPVERYQAWQLSL